VEFEQADAINRAIRLITLKHRALAGAHLAELGLHTGQEVLLMELDAHGPRTQVRLAAGLGVEPPSVTLMAKKLEEAGLIARRRSSSDTRAIVVELTDEGRALIPQLRAVWRRLAEETVAGLEKTSAERLQDVLKDLACSLYPSGAPSSLDPIPQERTRADAIDGRLS
jgi:DNA-binding MarR family transcriptional regulator